MTRFAIALLFALSLPALAAGQNFIKSGTLSPADLATLTVDIETTGTINDLAMGFGGGDQSSNVAIGSSALSANTSAGTNNVAIGNSTLGASTDGDSNTALGWSALAAATSPDRTVAIGYQSISSGDFTGSDVVAIGAGAGINLASTIDSVFIGADAAADQTGGWDNVYIGSAAGANSTTGHSNVAIGRLAMNGTTTATNGIYIGRTAGYQITTGDGGVYIGSGAGATAADGTTAHTIGTFNTFIGRAVRAYSATDSHAVVIGGNAIGEGSNTTVIGKPNTTQAHIFGALLHRRKVIADTNGATLSASDEAGVPGGANGQIYTNQGASGAQTFNLPAAAQGMICSFYLAAAQDVNINPDNADQILGLTNAVGDAISSDATVGSRITLIAIDTTYWAAFDVGGTWTDVD